MKVYRNIKTWIGENKLSFFLLLVIILIGSLLRLYQVAGHATFLGDEGRDALVVKRMIVDHRFTLLGPTVSFGNLYLGPIYYYFMALPLWLWRFDPIGPAFMVAGFGILTIFLVWKLAWDFFNPKAAWVATTLYAVSPLVINHTRSSWNPNPMPFFAILAIYSLLKTAKEKDGRWLIPVGASLGIAFQLHYIAMAFIAVIAILLLFLRVRVAIWWYLVGFASFLALLSPQILFELRHNFVNTRAMLSFFFGKGEFETAAGVGLDRLAPLDLYFRLFRSLVANKIEMLGIGMGVIVFLLSFLVLLKEKSLRVKHLGLSVVFLWLFLGVLLIPLYRGVVHDHYLGFLFPAPFLLVGFAFSWIWEKKSLRILSYLSLAGFAALVIFNLSDTNIFSGVGPNYQVKRVKLVAETIAGDVGDEKFNLALVSPTGDFMALNYRYFLELAGKVPEEYSNFDNIDVLYVIEEIKWVAPSELGIWEVSTFGPSEVEKDWTFDFQVVVYKLVHLEEK